MKNMFFALCLLALSAVTPAKAQVSFESVTSYYCIQNTLSSDGSVTTAEKLHFFHNERFDPSPLPWGQNLFSGFCHNKILYGEIDSPLFPRLGSRPSSFLLFSYPYAGHNFHSLIFRDSPNNASGHLGYVLEPQLIGPTYSCPEVGVPTEKLYAAITAIPGIGGDTLLLPQAEISRVWFFMRNGVPTAPSSDLDRTRTLYFYWPLNVNTPFVKHHDQKLFRVVFAQEAGISTIPLREGADRSIGCVPKQTVYPTAEGLSVGESCSFDVDCASLNCSVTTNTCAVTSELKPMGQACLASTMCEKVGVTVTRTVVTGRDSMGRITCAERSSIEQVHASCLFDVCVPPQSFRSESDPRCSSR